MKTDAVVISPVATKADRHDFMRMTDALYADDPNYVAPLAIELGPRLDPKLNPELKNDHQLWLATRGAKTVGRIAAIVNKSHLDRYNDGAGHFGFFECEDNAETAKALIDTASQWLKSKGMRKVFGPANFSVNEECGLLIDGFDTPPFVMMAHGKPYYQTMLESLGFTKAVDMHALEWLPRRDFIPQKRLDFVNKVLDKANVEIRNLNRKDLLGDIAIIIDIFNDAWSDNWGFIPFGEDHLHQMAREMKPIIENHNVVICYYKGEPVAFGLVLPNFNYAIRDFDGKLFPFNWAKLIYRLKIKGVQESRMPLMGVRQSLQKKPVGAALAYKIIDLVNGSNIDHGVVRSECSWILETNQSMLTMLIDMGSRIYKTYRIYERAL